MVSAPNLPRREVIIYTDAATSARTIASLVTDASDFEVRREFRTLWAGTSDSQRESAFISTTYIYGLEMWDILATIFLDAYFPRGECLLLHWQF